MSSGGIALGFIVGLMVVGRRAWLSPVGSLNTSCTLPARGEFSTIIANLALAGGLAGILQPFAALYVLILASLAPVLAKESERIYDLYTSLPETPLNASGHRGLTGRGGAGPHRSATASPERVAGPDPRPTVAEAAVAGSYDNRGVSMTVNVWTVGHSTMTIDQFLALLSGYGIGALADVRRFPGSRRHPHFNREPLAASLARAGIEYMPLPELGGRRRPTPDSPNTAWRNDSFRGYADHMDTDEFRSGVERLRDCARAKRTAFMCSELLWWRCHRALVSDYLKARGAKVIHILGPDKNAEHPYTSAARLVDGVLTYAAL